MRYNIDIAIKRYTPTFYELYSIAQLLGMNWVDLATTIDKFIESEKVSVNEDLHYEWLGN